MEALQQFTTTFQTGWALLTPEQRRQAQPYIGSICGITNSGNALATTASTSFPPGSGPSPHPPNPGPAPPHNHEGGACPSWVAKGNRHSCGGGCGGSCSDCKMVGGMCQFPNSPGAAPMLVPLGEAPECYDCDCIDPCLYPLLVQARNDFDDYAWQELWKEESPIVHLDKSVGLAADYNDNTPLASSEKILYVQEDGQQLPWVPGLVKVEGKFSLEPGQAGKVTFQFDGFNLLNSGVATAFRQTTVNYREVTELLAPRIFRVGFRWDF